MSKVSRALADAGRRIGDERVFHRRRIAEVLRRITVGDEPMLFGATFRRHSSRVDRFVFRQRRRCGELRGIFATSTQNKVCHRSFRTIENNDRRLFTTRLTRRHDELTSSRRFGTFPVGDTFGEREKQCRLIV